MGVGLIEIFKNPKHTEEREYYYIIRWPWSLTNNLIPHNIPNFSEKFINRFLNKINISLNSCWLWKISYKSHKYGEIFYKGQNYKAHRVSYMLANPNINITHLKIRHICNNKLCVNPEHLEIGSQQDNMRDRPEVKKYKAFGEEKYRLEWFEDKRRHPSIVLGTFKTRIVQLKWSIEKALTTPTRKYNINNES